MTDEEIKALVDEFNRKVSLDPEIRSVMQKIQNQDADFSDTSRMFWRRSELLRNYLQGIVLDLLAGARERLCTALLNTGYHKTNEALQSVQRALDVSQGIHLNPVQPKRPDERIHTVAHALEDPTVPDEKIVRRAGAPVANVQMSFHDDYIKENAKIRAKLGMKPTITRYGSGCCQWCADVAGRYKFGEQPKDIFRRHDNCGCVIIYDNQVLRGHQNEDGGRSKKWEEVKPEDVLADGFSPKIFSESEAQNLQEEMLERLTKPGQGDIMRVADAASAAGVKPAANSKEELEYKTKQYDKMLNDYASKKSKWSGNVFRVSFAFMKNATGQKEWSCSISIREDAGDKTIIHELLHARSCSYFTKDEFRRYKNLEECAVELFAQEICKNRSLPYTESYPLFVSYLKDINRIAGIRQSDYDFASELYNTDMPKRINWLKSEVQKSLSAGRISETDNSILNFYLEELEKGVLE